MCAAITKEKHCTMYQIASRDCKLKEWYRYGFYKNFYKNKRPYHLKGIWNVLIKEKNILFYKKIFKHLKKEVS